MDLPATPSPFVYLTIAKTIDMMGDEASAQPILAMAQETLADEIAQIRQLVGASDVQGAGRVLHTVKGSLPLFASDALVEQVTGLERACKTGAVPAQEESFSAVLTALDQLLADIRAYLGTPASDLQ